MCTLSVGTELTPRQEVNILTCGQTCCAAVWHSCTHLQCGRGIDDFCRSREEAFRIGTEIAKEVTASNPPPVTLKFEKVYHPCVLLTKKRYVGYMYESPTQVSPHQTNTPANHTLHPVLCAASIAGVAAFTVLCWAEVASFAVPSQCGEDAAPALGPSSHYRNATKHLP